MSIHNLRGYKEMGNIREYGNTPYKYLVLHGGPGAPGCAAGLCRGLGKKAGVLEHLQKSHTIEGLFDEIKCIIEEYSLNEVILVGHSFGAWLALLFAEKYPQFVSKVVIIGCGPLEIKCSARQMDRDIFPSISNYLEANKQRLKEYSKSRQRNRG